MVAVSPQPAVEATRITALVRAVANFSDLKSPHFRSTKSKKGHASRRNPLI